MRKKRKGKNRLLFRVFVLLSAVLVFIGTLGVLAGKTPQISHISSTESEDTIQIGFFTPGSSPTVPSTVTPTTAEPMKKLPTPTETSAPTCGIASEGGLRTHIDFNGKCCVEDGPEELGIPCCGGVPDAGFRHNPLTGRDYHWCNAKPVIYLYPKTPTYVNVSVVVPGEITVSIPEYPSNGWKDVLAYPSGDLIYEGKTYSELFYESSIKPIAPPTKGFLVQSQNLKTFLSDFTMKLGLKNHEKDEFLSYWMPRLQELNSPYIFVSVFDPITKDKIDRVDILPNPDTFIQMILYFRPEKKKITVSPIKIPPTPKRVGFTAVEWGGIIDNK